MNFVFMSCAFPKNYYLFCNALKNNGVNVIGIADVAYEDLDFKVKNSLSDYYQVSDMENYDEVYRAVAYLSFKHGKIDRLESNNEYWLERDAKLRTDFNILGLNEEQIKGIRYKSGMKKFYEKAKCKVARYHLTTTLEEGLKFIEEVSYPVVVKPDNGMGANNTFKIKNQEELENFYNMTFDSRMIMEEFIDGTLVSYDGISGYNKEILFETSSIYPVPIMDIVNEKIDTYFYTLKEIDKALSKAGRAVVEAFDTNARFFHCEFFILNKAKKGLGRKGDIIGLEVNLRPPGGNAPDMMNFARRIDVYQMWANMICYNETYTDYNKQVSYCGFASRRDGVSYELSNEEIAAKYSNNLVFNERGAEALAAAMGNQIFIATFENEEDVKDFTNDVIKK